MKNCITSLLTLIFVSQINLLQAQNFPAETWEKIEHPTLYGWDANKLSAIEEYIIDSTSTTGMMIIQNGKVVFEYGNVSENSYIASCRKSILAMLYGKYVADGTIQLDKSLEDLGISADGLLLEKEKKATIKDIISSRSGVYLPASNPGDMTFLAPERGTVNPGEYWVYNNWDFNMAGYIFEKETQKNIYDEIESQFAIPLQMEDWNRSLQEKDGDDLVSDILAYHIYFSTRDMARIGLLMLNNGKWNDQQIIPEYWVDEMVKPWSTFEELDQLNPNIKNDISQFSYGYMWWLWDKPKNDILEGAYSAQGAWGQNITIIPKINTVIVIKTNDLYSRQSGNHHFMIDEIAQMYNPELKEDLKYLTESIIANDVEQFVKDYRNSPPNANQANFQGVINRLGYYYLRLKEFDNALAIFKLNAEQYPTSWLVFDSLAEVYYRRGNFDEAITYYQKAVTLNPNNEWNNNARVTFIIERIKQMQ